MRLAPTKPASDLTKRATAAARSLFDNELSKRWFLVQFLWDNVTLCSSANKY